MKKFIIFLILIISLIFLYGKYIEPNNFKIKEYSVIDTNIPESFNGYKIIHLTDLYYENMQVCKKTEEYLNGWGGHSQALGLNIKPENIESFKNKIFDLTKDLVIVPTLKYHDEIHFQNINKALDFVKSVKPFGQDNPEPKWLIKDLKIPLNNKCEYYTISWNIYSYI